MKYIYGEEVRYKHDLVRPEDFDKLQAFSCGNSRMDDYIRHGLICNQVVDVSDALPYKVYDEKDGEIIAIYSLASSGIIVKLDNYTKVLPSIKIDIFAVDVKYQKMFMEKASEMSSDPDNHFYLSDCVLCDVIRKCRSISESTIAANYIVLYADKDARRFYERNLFEDFSAYMEKELNMEA